MDRTGWIAVIACVAAMIYYTSWQGQKAQEFAAQQAEQQAAAAALAAEAAPAADPSKATAATGAIATPGATPSVTPVPTTTVDVEVEAQSFILENEFIRCHLTNIGAGIAEVELLKHTRSMSGEDGFITLNEEQTSPIAALSNGPGEVDNSGWQVVSHSDSEVAFIRDTIDGLRIQKRFWLPEASAAAGSDPVAGSDPHLVKMQITIRNISEAPMNVSRRFLYTGAAKPLHLREWSREIGYFWKGDDKMEFESVDSFSKGLMRKSKSYDEFMVENLAWAGVNDQFYTTLIRAEEPANATLWARHFPAVIDGDQEASQKKKLHGIVAGVGLPEFSLNVGDQRSFDYEFFLGPKQYSRLSDIGESRTEVMNYDELPIIGFMFGWAIRPLAAFLITSLEWLHNFVPYGVAIILITILIRIAIWPLYAKSTRTMKRMSKLTPKMKEIKEQYKDDPQKQNQEIMGLYKKYGVNPLGGCLPMFVQMPIFLGFYRMLSSAVELRHQSFLWVTDLSMPDTLFMIPGTELPFNLLPILMAVTMIIQMKVAPQSGDATQRMIFMFMPVMFLFICYNFAAALSLYWTTQNLFSIGQTWLMNKLPEPELKTKKGGESGGKGFMQRLQEKAEEQQRAKKNQLSGDKGQRHTPKKRKKR